jgi:hypothetical protein
MAAGKKSGRKSQAANDFLEPKAPTSVVATNVPSGRAYNNGRIDVTFTLPADSPAATSYTASGYCSVHSVTHTATGASSPLSITGFGSEVVTTITVVASNAVGNSPASAASNSVTVTTVPATPGAPSASSPNANQDVVSWSAPANGGSAITAYTWASSDSKTGSTGSTSVTVGQEAGTAQTYTVYATNANGNSGTSSASGSITTTFSFAPFSVFGFSPFGVFGFSPFGVFGFSPFGFSPFGFSPFGFSPFGFSPSAYGVRCIDSETFIRIKPGIGVESTDPETGKVTLKNSSGEVVAKKAKDISVGDTVYSINYLEIDQSTPDYEVFAWNSDSLTFAGDTETTIVDVEESVRSQTICFNNDQSAQFTLEHPLLINKNINGVSTHVFSMVAEVEVGDSIVKYNSATGNTEEVLVNSIDVLPGSKTVYTFSAEPVDLIIAGDVVTHNK